MSCFLRQERRAHGASPEGPASEKRWFLAKRLGSWHAPRAVHLYNGFSQVHRSREQKRDVFRRPKSDGVNCSVTKTSNMRKSHFSRAKLLFEERHINRGANGWKTWFFLRKNQLLYIFMFRGMPIFRGWLYRAQVKPLPGHGKGTPRRSYPAHSPKKGAEHVFPNFSDFSRSSKRTEVQASPRRSSNVF